MRIYPPRKVYVAPSKIHGLGVFADYKISKGELIEVVPITDLKIEKGGLNNCLLDYRFNWPQGSNPEQQVAAWGYGSIYNHSETPNAYWKSNIENYTFEFYALKDIEQDEEICTYYGDTNYWNNGRTHIKVL
jgi:SET domain-containing protein